MGAQDGGEASAAGGYSFLSEFGDGTSRTPPTPVGVLFGLCVVFLILIFSRLNENSSLSMLPDARRASTASSAGVGGGGTRGTKKQKAAGSQEDGEWEYYDDDGKGAAAKGPAFEPPSDAEESEEERAARGEARAPPLRNEAASAASVQGDEAVKGDALAKTAKSGAAAAETDAPAAADEAEKLAKKARKKAARSARRASRPDGLILSKRPPRLPPSWLEEGNCEPPPGWEDEAEPYRTASAFGSFHEERHGETLLGSCDCPLMGESAKNADGSPYVFDCGAYDWRILSDLAVSRRARPPKRCAFGAEFALPLIHSQSSPSSLPFPRSPNAPRTRSPPPLRRQPWHGVEITHDALDVAYNLQTANIPPGYHFSINKGRVFMRMREPTSGEPERERP